MTASEQHKHDKTQSRQVRREAFKKLGIILLALLFAVNTIQLARFGEIVERVDFNNKGVIDELGGIRADVTEFGNDMNEIRQFLLLPTKEYSFMKGIVETQDTEEKKTTRTESALYSFLSQVSEEQTVKKNTEMAAVKVAALASDTDFTAKLAAAGLNPGKPENTDGAGQLKITDASSAPLFAFVIDTKTGKPEVQSVLGKYAVTAADDAALKTELLGYFTKNKEQVAQMKALVGTQKAAIEAFPANKDLAAALKEKKATFSGAEETGETIDYSIRNRDGDKLLTIGIQRKDGQIMFRDKSYKTADELLPEFLAAAKTVDASSSAEKLINERKTEIEGIFAQSAFLDILKNDGLTLVTVPREEANKLLYDVKGADGKVAFSFAIELSSGMFKIIRDGQEIDLYSFQDDGSKKKP
jgi:hypothetical protein